VSERIRITTERTQTDIGQADIVTNSGHVRPVDAEMVGWMKPSAVIPLMYEAWEFRDGDVDLEACKRRGIRVAGTNERHPSVDVFSYLGIMAVKLLLDAGIAVYGCKILVCCDNPFEPYLRRALRPQAHVVIGPTEAALIRERSPGAVVAQYWGDIDRSALDTAGVRYWPPAAPALGHMAILPAAVGPEPTVRLQAGGLKVAEILWRSRNPRARVDRSYLTELGVSDEV